MTNLNIPRTRELLKSFDLRPLFIEELGWDRHSGKLPVVIGSQDFLLEAIAEKRGMVAYLCATPSGQCLEDHSLRLKIEKQVAKTVHEHLIIFTDGAHARQIWQWVRREPGKPVACREHPFHRAQSGEALAQKLQTIAFSFDEEENLTLTDVTLGARASFDVERITKRFYDRFKKEHSGFLEFIAGIAESPDREWYASVMLNRLMFVYFVQRKGFLDGDHNYLRNRLRRMQIDHGKDRFYSFYRYFLLRLFHEGLGSKGRTSELEKLLGKIPYLNGGLFEKHSVEQRYSNIQIPDEAFERIFDYFDQYQWHLDERPLRADNEINPDVLGYIFEKYINQKQMGAYYTKEDITEYISKNTVLPFLFDAARTKCKIAFENPNGPTIWDLLKDDPDRLIYPAIKHGVSWDIYANDGKGASLKSIRKLPDEIADGLDDVSKRTKWNRPAPTDYALPTEIWREVVSRRRRYEEVRHKLSSGAVRNINDLITLNLDIRQFAQDAVESSEGPELLRAFWHAIQHVTVLDPTCGSGAFLFAALNILEPLYEACLGRMEAFVEDLDRSGEKHRPEQFSDFRNVLYRVEGHPNRRYFIFKNIILNNLFGVDIMEEAVEICKLRLFLKLAAQVEPDVTKENLGIEPLPDIDFNIRAGN
ncbi:MAG: DNA methyltransferase, partial [Terriglobia bacterium]